MKLEKIFPLAHQELSGNSTVHGEFEISTVISFVLHFKFFTFQMFSFHFQNHFTTTKNIFFCWIESKSKYFFSDFDGKELKEMADKKSDAVVKDDELDELLDSESLRKC